MGTAPLKSKKDFRKTRGNSGRNYWRGITWTNVRSERRAQLIDATHCENFSAGVWYCKVLLSDTFVRETMDLFSRITLAIVGIGAVEPSGMLARSGNVFSPRELADLTESGAVGDMSLRFFDAEGAYVKSPLDDRVIGMTLEELAKVERVMALAGGKAKTEAIRGALKTGIIDLLITDKFTAQRLVSPDATAPLTS